MKILICFVVVLLLFLTHPFTTIAMRILQPIRKTTLPFRSWLTQSTRLFSAPTNEASTAPVSSLLKNFVTNIIDADLASGKNGGRVLTRFPPEPNGYLHLGHAKSVNFNFAVAKHYNGKTNMRFDDTNPAKEDMEYVLSILDDVRWLVTGDTKKTDVEPWDGEIRHASDYFQITYELAEYLIEKGLAYVDHLSADEIREYRGTLTSPGKNSPYRDRSIEENLSLFRQMKDGKFEEGECVLRGKIDMSSSNMNLRDPTLYRIKYMNHPITGNQWCIYPMYDFAHAISDAYEGITHSLCTLEFADHRPLYDWTVNHFHDSGLSPFTKQGFKPNQYEFSRLNIQYTVLSKRKLIQLVNEKHVTGWSDPRMPTICGLRRRGFTAEILRLFCDRIGISKAENNIDYTVLEDCARDIFDEKSLRAFAIEKPLKVTITNLDNNNNDLLSLIIENHPKKPELGNRSLSFSSNLYINLDDFFDTGIDGKIAPPKGFKRLVKGGQVRLKFAYVITCDEVIRDPSTNEVIELKCRYHADTKGGKTPEGMKKVKGIIQWLSDKDAVSIVLNVYDRLFLTPNPGNEQPDGDFLKDINPNSLTVLSNALVEKNVIDNIVEKGKRDAYQFERVGYFILDDVDSKVEDKKYVFNRIVTLKDGWNQKS